MRFVRMGTLAFAVLATACDTSRAIVETGAASAPCTQCHGYPPPPYVTQAGADHPTSLTGAPLDCHACHPGTVEADNVTIVPGGLHMDGIVEYTGTDHAHPFVGHEAAALAAIDTCQGCHGTDYDGGSTGQSCNRCHATVTGSGPDWKTNCTFCHGTRTAGVTTATAAAAPPVAVDRTNAPAKVGAHQAHLSATLATPIACGACHAVPQPAQALTHFTGGPAAVAFTGVAAQGVASASYAGSGGTCSVYCHGAGTSWPAGSVSTPPPWTASATTCTTCHGNPPPTGPPVNGGPPAHVFHVTNRGQPCSRCHNGYTGSSVTAATHVDGTRDVIVVPTGGGTLRINGWSCNTCHSALGV